MITLDGNKTAKDIKDELAVEVKEITKAGQRPPHLVAVLVGNNGASVTYVNWKVKDCEEVGYKSTLLKLSDTVSEKELLDEIERLNEDDGVDGFIVQLPLPKHIDEQNVIRAIKPEKDVDGFHPENVGKMALNLPTFLPATPAGIIELLDRYNIETGGKHCVVVGRSHIVGMPISVLMSQNHYPGNCTVTITHSRTRNLEKLLKEADIIIAALGKPDFVTGEMVKKGAVVIDVGISRVPDTTKKSGYRIAGDVHFESVSKKSSFITPVPGGVGPMTRAMLLKNTMLAYKMRTH
ncbi:MAG: bifunctional 5,10-methylene-tetrahydrofolate dehydrogenase/5,10-methylene-tetrahydrofolate cyclohydrolase [Crocinitomicaceae bacterium]|nr:bifunctional 5,10-methylene-tetrahydrofolate dehydrogenase/5,10-methylene-tetrahydrofolate cyclohydrolase [Crocinitomicaceae bacterium]|tara:strand:- start:125 stop:1003 length:879 start_codon:yes stop_codon:yes gene_type:complete